MQESVRCSFPRTQVIVFSLVFLSCSCHGKAEECIGLCRAMLCTVVWLLQGCAWYCERLRESGALPVLENSLRACLERMTNLLHSTKNRALVHIARLEEQGVFIYQGFTIIIIFMTYLQHCRNILILYSPYLVLVYSWTYVSFDSFQRIRQTV